MNFATFFLVSAFICGTFAQNNETTDNNSPLVAPTITLASGSKIQQIDFNYLENYIGDCVRNYNMLIARLSKLVRNEFRQLKQDIQTALTNDAQGNPLPKEINTYDDFENWIQSLKGAVKTFIDDTRTALTDFEGTYSRDDRHILFVKGFNNLILLGRINILEMVVMVKNNKLTGPFSDIIKTMVEQFGSGAASDPVGALWKFIQGSNLGGIFGVPNVDNYSPGQTDDGDNSPRGNENGPPQYDQ